MQNIIGFISICLERD